ncbi:MAG: dienelactone hydrolase family protein, partial [Pseudomonadota bacterium]
LTTPDDQNYSKADAPILIAHGAADASISMQAVAKLSEELEAAKATYTIEVYSGAPHAFTVFGSDRYQKRADNLSWASFKDFLTANLTN